MNEFDKILRDKLNEEDDFPRMDQNWQKLSARMTAVTMPAPKLVPHPQLVAWKWAMAATGLLLVTSNIWWWFHQKGATNTVVSAPIIEQKQPNAPTQTTTVYKTDTVYVYRDAVPNKVQKGDVFQKENAVNERIAANSSPSQKPSVQKVSEPKPIVTKQNLDKKPLVADKAIEKNTPIANSNNVEKKANKELEKAHKSVLSDNKVEKNEIQPVVSNEKKEGNEAVVSNEKNKQEPLKIAEKEAEKSQNTEGEVKGTVAENTPINGTNKATTDAIKPDTANKIAAVETPKEAKTGSPTAILPDKKEEKAGNPVVTTPLVKEGSENKQDMEMTPVIRPFKWKPEFSIGVNALAALPIGNDFSVMKGGGIALGMKISDHFRIDATGSTGKLSYTLKEHKPRWHIPGDPRSKPNGPPVDAVLQEIQGLQTRKQAALSLSYLFNSKGWLTPKIEMGYAIQRIANQTAKFEFRDPRTGKELYLVEILEPQTIKNLWHLGAGVEKTFGNFTADLTATYQKDFSDKSVDMLVLRGGLRYNF